LTWRIAIDTGGTFTDVVALNEDTGAEGVVKVESTPDDPSRALLHGIEAVVEQLGLEPADVSVVMHGTTAATNAILEGKYSTIGLVVTKGFRDILEVRRQDVPGDFGDITWWIKPPRVVPLELVREVDGRLAFDGAELRPLDDEGVRRVAREYRELGISAIAVSFIHSYRNPEHEERCRELILAEHPGAFVSISSDVIREYREYERTLGTCLNTGLMPLMTSYVGRIEERLAASGFDARLYIMKSSGGVAHAPELMTRPIASVLSGPAAGVIAASVNGPAAGHEDLLTLDVGGTSADIALIEGRMPRILNEGRIEEHDIKVPMIDMTAVGAGGGSIAWVAASGSLKVGPESAGSTPGPVCYGKGGDRPTVTDAQLVLGRISPYLLGGTIELDEPAAKEAIREQIAEPLGFSVEKAADGVLEIAVGNMATGIRLVSVRRGRDPRSYTLFPFGGGGGMHACLTADVLGMTRIVVPRAPGATSAEGLLFSDVRVDHTRTSVQREDELDVVRFEAELDALREQAAGELRAQGFADELVGFELHAEMRYAGQAYEVRVPLDDTLPAEDALRAAFGAFHAAHEDRYGFSYAGDEVVELVNIGIAGFGALARPATAVPSAADAQWRDFHKYDRPMYVRSHSRLRECAVYERPTVAVADTLPGPAVVEQYDTTVVVDEGWHAVATPGGSLLLERSG
jgi:N-methylhydantoinase A